MTKQKPRKRVTSTGPLRPGSVLAFTAFIAFALTNSARAQGVVNGSTGADGALDVATDTVRALPPDGVLNFTTVHVRPGATLTFTPNERNTPVYLLATGNVLIEGTISVNGGNATTTAGGVGGPGGYAGGTPGTTGVPPGAGIGPGAGRGGAERTSDPTGAGGGGYRTRQYYFVNYPAYHKNDANRGATYGSPLLVPLVGGSGGGGTSGGTAWGGGGGGGAVLIASDTRIEVSGRVEALGGTGVPTTSCSSASLNHGSGGAIRLVAPTVAGSGTIDTRGGATHQTCGDSPRAGHGRARVDSIYRAEANLTFSPSDSRLFGTYLVARHLNLPRVDIAEAAGTPITGDTPVLVTLPFGTPATQTVRVVLSGFPELANVTVRLTPMNGDPVTYGPFLVPVGGASVEHVITVDIPPNNPTHIQAWAQPEPYGA